jgi:hypothetical protein
MKPTLRHFAEALHVVLAGPREERAQARAGWVQVPSRQRVGRSLPWALVVDECRDAGGLVVGRRADDQAKRRAGVHPLFVTAFR